MKEAKKYWVGDLCYVMHPEWDEFCELTISGHDCSDGTFVLQDGRKFAFKSTAHGDGEYHDQHGKAYPVDAGIIGVIAVEDIRDPEAITGPNIGLGNIYAFDQFPDVFRDDDGVIYIGTLRIPTSFERDSEDEDYDPEEDDDEQF